MVVGEVEGNVVVDLHDQERPEGRGWATPSSSARKVADSACPRTRTMVWLSWTGIGAPWSLVPASLATGSAAGYGQLW